jgi:hypothetical protein
MPFSVINTVLLDGGTIVTATGVDPPVGGVMVLAPEANVIISIWPGLAAFTAASYSRVAATSPVKSIIDSRSADTAILSIL